MFKSANFDSASNLGELLQIGLEPRPVQNEPTQQPSRGRVPARVCAPVHLATRSSSRTPRLPPTSTPRLSGARLPARPWRSIISTLSVARSISFTLHTLQGSRGRWASFLAFRMPCSASLAISRPSYVFHQHHPNPGLVVVAKRSRPPAASLFSLSSSNAASASVWRAWAPPASQIGAPKSKKRPPTVIREKAPITPGS